MNDIVAHFVISALRVPRSGRVERSISLCKTRGLLGVSGGDVFISKFHSSTSRQMPLCRLTDACKRPTPVSQTHNWLVDGVMSTWQSHARRFYYNVRWCGNLIATGAMRWQQCQADTMRCDTLNWNFVFNKNENKICKKLIVVSSICSHSGSSITRLVYIVAPNPHMSQWTHRMLLMDRLLFFFIF